MKTFITTLMVLVAVVISISLAPGPSHNQIAVELLEKQSKAWNNADIPSFMDTYWKSDDLQFLGKEGLIKGWKDTEARYYRTYPDPQAMGKLKFDILEVNTRSRNVFTVIGRYHLDRSGLENLSGHFILVCQKIRRKWVIVADSTH